MWAYVVIAKFTGLGDEKFQMVIHHAGPAKAVESEVARDGWNIKRVRKASIDDIQDLEKYEAVLERVKAETIRRRAADADRQRRAEANAQRLSEEAKRQQVAREKAAAESHELAIGRAAGDLLNIQLESALHGNKKLAAICAKVRLFFNQASLNRRDLYTAISIDFADFQSEFDFPRANKLLSALVGDLNNFLKIGGGVEHIRSQLAAERLSVENQINSIASRSHIFGGSGEGLLLSMWCASSAVKEDEKAIQALKAAHSRTIGQVKETVDEAAIRQKLIEYRAKTAASLLLAACGKSESIDINLPRDVEWYILKN